MVRRLFVEKKKGFDIEAQGLLSDFKYSLGIDENAEISIDDYKEKVWPLPVNELLYVGRSTVQKLKFYGVHTIGQLAATSPGLLKSWFGVTGEQLWHFANGTDTSKVMHKDYKSEVKSIGHGITCKQDLVSE